MLTNLRFGGGMLMLVVAVVFFVLVAVMMRFSVVFVAVMLLVMVFTPVRMAMLFVVPGILVGVAMMTMFVRMVMLVVVSAHDRSSYPLASERSPPWGVRGNLDKDYAGTCQSTESFVKNRLPPFFSWMASFLKMVFDRNVCSGVDIAVRGKKFNS
jgi:hypothetical protein